LENNTGMKSREIRAAFEVRESAVNKTVLSKCGQIRTKRNLRKKIGKIVNSDFKV